MTVQIALTGDVMLGRLVDRLIIQDESIPPDSLWGDVLPLLRAADLRLINLECVISTRGAKWRPARKPFHFRAHPRALAFLQAVPIECVTLANNHILDYGPEALLDCLDRLDAAGIRRAGAGRTLEEARAPALMATAAGPVAVLALTNNEPEWAAAANRPGVHFVDYDEQGLRPPYRAEVAALIAAARRQASLVIVSAHIGPNWGTPAPAMRALAHNLLDLGADLYWGHSNHTPQGIEIYNARPILYSTGDFIDDYAIDPVERNDRSFLFGVEVADGRIRRVQLYPVAIDRLRVRRADAEEAGFLLERMQRLSADLGSRLHLHANWCELEIA